MTEKDFKEILENTKKSYYSIGSIPCPILEGKLVHFNTHGWNHLIRKGGQLRNHKDQLGRLRLIRWVKKIITNCPEIYSHTIFNDAQFWTLKLTIERKIVTVILRQTGNGYIHFFSIYG